ncbi:class I SAM-dependent methyltransferase [Sphaerisporangium sp. B11E5]|uniref:class I SAM-dependent methyltransferase n=1 Tax=Sphaerisporangium sp. B11E5 TaxID=3153563 RepID=UPI00325E0F49
MPSEPTSPDVRPGSGLVLGDDPVAALEAASWALAAMIGTMREALTAPVADVLATAPERTAVLEAVGLVTREHGGLTLHPSLRDATGQTAVGAVEAKLSSLRQAVSAAAAPVAHDAANGGWAGLDDEVLLNQGRASAVTGHALATKIVPQLTGLADRLGTADGRILDVGTGVAALAVALARAFPRAHVVGIDILDRVLDLARIELAGAGDAAGRVSLRRQDVAELAEHAAYDLVWLPAPFLTEAALSAALPRAIDALRPGGWMVVGTNPASPDSLLRAVGRWTAVLHGGNSYDTERMAATLTASGLRETRRFPTVKGGPVLVAARSPQG